MTADPEYGRQAINAGRIGSEWRQTLDDATMESLAASVHEVFLESQRADQVGSPSAAVPYDQLPDHLKEQNRENVRDMAVKLALVGYSIAPAQDDEQPLILSDPFLEQLARREHERWMEVMLADGWRYGPETNRVRKRHSSLVPWEELPDSEKRKDRELVRQMPRILATAGFAIVEIVDDRPE